MTAGNKSPIAPAPLTLDITRVFDAPRALVFQAWTQRQHVMNWCAPTGFVVTYSEADVIIGGAWRSCMRSPQGVDHWVGGIYREVVQDRRLVFTHIWDTTDGSPGYETLVELTFADEGQKTKMTFHQSNFKSIASRDDHEGGWTEAFERLGTRLHDLSRRSSMPAENNCFVITRTFNAPRDVVFKAWTDSTQLSQWWGPSCFTNPTCKLDVRPGGTYHIVMRSPDGIDYPMKGIYREVNPNERLVYTNDLSGNPTEWQNLINPNRPHGTAATEPLTTVTFEEHDGKTTITVRMDFESAAIRDAMLKVGMNEGWSQSLDSLTQLLAPKAEPFVIERVFNAPVAKVWTAITDKDAMKKWYFDLPEFKPEVGFEFQFDASDKGITYSHRCVVKEVIPQQKIAYTWRYEGHPGNSLVTFQLFPQGNQTRLRLTHEGLETFPRLPGFARKNFAWGWTSLIGISLKNFVEQIK